MNFNEETNDELLTQTELCQWLKIDPATAYRWRQQGMPHIGRHKNLRYKKDEVLEWLNNKKE